MVGREGRIVSGVTTCNYKCHKRQGRAAGRPTMTRLQAVGIAAALLASAIPVRAEEPQAVLTRAIKAMGGDVDPARNPSTSAKVRIKGIEIPANATGEIHFQAATALRFDVTIQFGTDKQVGTVAFDGKSGWADMNGTAQDMAQSELRMKRAVVRLVSPAL